MFVFSPAPNFEVDRTDKILIVIEIDLDLLLSEGVFQKLLRIVDQLLIRSGRIFAQVMKDHDHPFLHFLQHLYPATRINLPELGLDHLLCRLGTVFTGFHRLSKFG